MDATALLRSAIAAMIGNSDIDVRAGGLPNAEGWLICMALAT